MDISGKIFMTVGESLLSHVAISCGTHRRTMATFRGGVKKKQGGFLQHQARFNAHYGALNAVPLRTRTVDIKLMYINQY